jgi:O-antigen biosynthesis protein
MQFTGERFIPSLQGEIRLEHYHRYAVVLDVVSRKDVLDIACGEGYGSYLMSEVAKSVIGVDISDETIQHASRAYGHRPNLTFRQGAATKISFSDAAFDIVVSFETIEHLAEQSEMLCEIRRLLRPNGLFIISSPNRSIYSAVMGNRNVFHVKELDFGEFDTLLTRHFAAIKYFGQRMLAGSAIQPIKRQQSNFRVWTDNGSSVTPNANTPEPVYFLALCADSEDALPDLGSSLLYPTHFDVVEAYQKNMRWARDLNEALAERDQRISSLNEALAARDRRIAGLNEALAERDRSIVGLNEVVAERDQRIVGLNEALAGAGRKIASLVTTWRRENRRVIVLNAAVSNRDIQIAELRSSSSWRLTAPLRFAKIKLQAIKALFRIAPDLRHRLDEQPPKRDRPSNPDLYTERWLEGPHLTPKVSVIVPHYNHAQYLRARLDSIYGQSYRNIEVILLDDCSNDGGLDILREYASRFPDRTKCCFNDCNSGGTFSQWKRGLEFATGELVWIAESDDYCTTNFLDELVRYFDNQAVMLAYSRSDFVRGDPPEQVWTIEEYLSDLDLECWSEPFIRSANWLVNNAWAIKNIVPNVSSAVFRNPRKLSLLESEEWRRLRLCGDWIFYLTIIRGGLVAYTPHATNCYRQHPENTSVSAQKEDAYYREHEIVAKHLLSLYRLDFGVMERQCAHLYRHWAASRGNSSKNEFKALYNLDRVKEVAATRKRNLAMVGYALTAGGGETFPIMLANLLKDHGYCVTFLNCAQERTEPGIRRMLGPDVPLLELDTLELVQAVFEDLGVELVHSHHGWVDLTLSSLLSLDPGIKRIVTLHGMYETMSKEQIEGILPILEAHIDRFVYTAEKNLTPFPVTFRRAKGFVRINNALLPSNIKPVPRTELGIAQEDFVLCLVARAIPEKGWDEGIQAAAWARAHSKKSIHLLIIGDGPELDRLRAKVRDDFIHFLGFRANIRDFFATSDLGFLPSRFRGESSPLVVIDCLQSGRPVLASNIGEIAQMLHSEGGLAGELFDLDDWAIPIQKVGQLIVDLAEDDERFRALLRRVTSAASKFDPSTMLKHYDAVYHNCFIPTEEAVACSLVGTDSSGHPW